MGGGVSEEGRKRYSRSLHKQARKAESFYQAHELSEDIKRKVFAESGESWRTTALGQRKRGL